MADTVDKIALSKEWHSQIKRFGYATCKNGECNLSFLSISGIRSHVWKCFGMPMNQGAYVPCEICGVQFSQYHNVVIHKMKNHEVDKSPNLKSEDPALDETIDEKNDFISSKPQSTPRVPNCGPGKISKNQQAVRKLSPIKPAEPPNHQGFVNYHIPGLSGSSTTDGYREQVQFCSPNQPDNNHSGVTTTNQTIQQTFIPYQLPATTAFYNNPLSPTVTSQCPLSLNTVEPRQPGPKIYFGGIRPNNKIIGSSVRANLGNTSDLLKVRKQDGTIVWLRSCPKSSAANMPTRLTPVAKSSNSGQIRFVPNPAVVHISTPANIPISTTYSGFASTPGLRPGLTSISSLSSTSYSIKSSGTTSNSQGTPLTNKTSIQAQSNFQSQSSSFQQNSLKQQKPNINSTVSTQPSLTYPSQGIKAKYTLYKNSPIQHTLSTGPTQKLPCPLIVLGSGGSLDSSHDATIEQSPTLRQNLSLDEESVSGIKPLSSESESQSTVEPSASDTKFGGKPGSEDSKSWLDGNNSDFTASSKQFLHSSSSLVSGLDKKESPISQREKELLEKEAKIIEFENMVRETVLRAKQIKKERELKEREKRLREKEDQLRQREVEARKELEEARKLLEEDGGTDEDDFILPHSSNFYLPSSLGNWNIEDEQVTLTREELEELDPAKRPKNAVIVESSKSLGSISGTSESCSPPRQFPDTPGDFGSSFQTSESFIPTREGTNKTQDNFSDNLPPSPPSDEVCSPTQPSSSNSICDNFINKSTDSRISNEKSNLVRDKGEDGNKSPKTSSDIIPDLADSSGVHQREHISSWKDQDEPVDLSKPRTLSPSDIQIFNPANSQKDAEKHSLSNSTTENIPVVEKTKLNNMCEMNYIGDSLVIPFPEFDDGNLEDLLENSDGRMVYLTLSPDGKHLHLPEPSAAPDTILPTKISNGENQFSKDTVGKHLDREEQEESIEKRIDREEDLETDKHIVREDSLDIAEPSITAEASVFAELKPGTALSSESEKTYQEDEISHHKETIGETRSSPRKVLLCQNYPENDRNQGEQQPEFSNKILKEGLNWADQDVPLNVDNYNNDLYEDGIQNYQKEIDRISERLESSSVEPSPNHDVFETINSGCQTPDRFDDSTLDKPQTETESNLTGENDHDQTHAVDNEMITETLENIDTEDDINVDDIVDLLDDGVDTNHEDSVTPEEDLDVRKPPQKSPRKKKKSNVQKVKNSDANPSPKKLKTGSRKHNSEQSDLEEIEFEKKMPRRKKKTKIKKEKSVKLRDRRSIAVLDAADCNSSSRRSLRISMKKDTNSPKKSQGKENAEKKEKRQSKDKNSSIDEFLDSDYEVEKKKNKKDVRIKSEIVTKKKKRIRVVSEDEIEESRDTKISKLDEDIPEYGKRKRAAACVAEKKFQLISRDRSPGDLSDISLQGSEDSEDNFDISKEFNPKKIYKLFRNYEGERMFRCLLCSEVYNKKEKIIDHSMREHDIELFPAQDGYSDEEYTEKIKFKKTTGRAGSPLNSLDPDTEFMVKEAKYRKDNFSTSKVTRTRDSRPISEPLRNEDEFFPKETTSARFQLNRSESSRVEHYTLSRFESKILNGTGIIFSAGPVWAMSWVPQPAFKLTQYLAVSTHHDHKETLYSSELIEPGFIQLWRVVIEPDQNISEDPKLILGIAHSYGKIWDLEWCPSGRWEESISLGDLAAACSDGTVRIFEVRFPKKGRKFVKLEASKSLIPSEQSQGHCLSVSWYRGPKHRYIAGSFVSGLVCVWDLESESSLTNTSEGTLPILSWTAHASTVNGISLASSSTEFPEYCATGGSDRSYRFWDLRDTCSPIQEVKRGLVTRVDWIPGLHAAAVCHDDVYLQSHTQTLISETGVTKNASQPVIGQNSCIWDQSVSPWLGGLAVCSSAGELVIYMMPDRNKSVDQNRSSGKRRAYVYMTKNITEDDKSETGSNDKDDINKFSLSFIDLLDAVDASSNEKELKRKVRYSEKMCGENVLNYPICSLNRVEWNMNLGSHLLLASGGQSGLVRIHSLTSLNTDKLKSTLKCINK